MDTTRATQGADQPTRVATSVRQSRRRRRPPARRRHCPGTSRPPDSLLAAVGLVAVFAVSLSPATAPPSR